MQPLDPTHISQEVEDDFLRSDRRHVLMLSTHGVHQWQVVPGLPDTGGQNVFVNQFSDALVREGYRVTICNRGGYPHPVTGVRQAGVHYKDAFQRLVYLEDGRDEFVRKEDMGACVADLAAWLARFLDDEGSHADMIISHYWDAARVGELYKGSISPTLMHIWVPHSLGRIKKENVGEDQWASLRIDERIETEAELLSSLEAVVATSSKIRSSLRNAYDYKGKIPFMPPCVDPQRFHPLEVHPDDEIWAFLAEQGSLEIAELRDARIITEISRTDRTKRKDILIEAFANLLRAVPDAVLILSIDQRKRDIANELHALITSLAIRDRLIEVGSVWEWLPKIYAITDVYCTPSVMEGFGMSAQEAAATGVPVVASDLVPFVSEYLLDGEVSELQCDGCSRPPRVGEGAIEVRADDVKGFSEALAFLLRYEARRREMGKRALEITVPYFTWQHRTSEFLSELNLPGANQG